jgi:hypothetical protein
MSGKKRKSGRGKSGEKSLEIGNTGSHSVESRLSGYSVAAF